MAAIVRKPNMNRVYITGNVDPIRQLLSDFHAHTDRAYKWCPCTDTPSPSSEPRKYCGACDYGKIWGEWRYWLPLHQEPNLRAALKAEAEYQAKLAAELATWEQAKSVIPAEYRTRHGAALGGRVTINGESFDEPALETGKLPWTLVTSYERRVRDLTGQSLIAGRVEDSDTLYSAVTADGRAIYRISHDRGFGDDLRETYYLPPDLWARLLLAEIQMRHITPDQARKWLEEARGCVGTELYEAAADPDSLITLAIG